MSIVIGYDDNERTEIYSVDNNESFLNSFTEINNIGTFTSKYYIGEQFIDFLSIHNIMEVSERFFTQTVLHGKKIIDLDWMEILNPLGNQHLYFYAFSSLIKEIYIIKDRNKGLHKLISSTTEMSELLLRFKANQSTLIKDLNIAFRFCFDVDYDDKLTNLSALQRFALFKKYEHPTTMIATIFENPPIKIALLPECSGSSKIEDIDLLNRIETKPMNYYQCFGLTAILNIELVKMIENNIKVKKCMNCQKYFVLKGDYNTKYCDRKNEYGKTCKEVGAMKAQQEKIKQNPILDEYTKAYKKINNKKRFGKISESDFTNWATLAREMRDKATNNEITFENFISWLNEYQI